MKKRIFTLIMAFLAIAGNAVWGQSTSQYDATITINGTSITSENTGDRWSYQQGEKDNNVLEITKEGHYFIESIGTSHSTTNNNTNIQILIKTEGTYYITLKDVRTDAQLNGSFGGTLLYPDHCAFQIGNDAEVNVIVELDWEGSNKFWSGAKRAGINVKPGATLILKDKNPESGDSLEAGSLCNSGETGSSYDVSDTYGAGIGGDYENPNFGTIIIESGKVLARCESKGNAGEAYAAGIGGGYSMDEDKTPSSLTGSIIILGGTVDAASWSSDSKDASYSKDETNEYAWGAAIGGGYKGTCDNITILGGEIKTTVPNERGNAIGVGHEYISSTSPKHPEIIIGNKDRNTNVSVTTTNIDGTNYVNGREDNPTKTGTVTMPDGLQMYVKSPFTGEGTFNAYNVKLEKTLLGENHNVIGWENNADDVQHYFLGAGKELAIDALKCSETPSDLFMGWYKSDEDVVAVTTSGGDEKTTFTAPEEVSSESVTYYAVWVESERSITIKTGENGKDWTTDGDGPKINYVPVKSANENEDAGKALQFSILKYDDGETSPDELQDWKFKGNQLQGKSNLLNGDTYKQIKVTAQVKMGSCTKDITLNVTLRKDVTISNIAIRSYEKSVIY